jgi:hypothetical protein
MRETIFISHANPEDNYFAAWLAAKLNVLGYKAWVDVEDLHVGDAFFTTIHPIIKEDSICFIAVNSESYLEKARNQNSGVSRELNTAISVKEIKNFILPIRIDSTDYNDFPAHYASWNTIDFYNNWQSGLIKLIEQFEKLTVPKIQLANNPFDIWFKAINNKNQVIKKEESYYSNWFPFELPEYIFIHHPDCIEDQIYASMPYPIILEAKRIITFVSESTARKLLPLHGSFRIETESLIGCSDLQIDKQFTLKDAEKKLVRLLNKCFNLHLKNFDLSYWKKRNINYFRRGEVEDRPVSLKNRYGKGNRVLVGEKTTKINGKKRLINWHYAISPRVTLHPVPHMRLNYTLVFTNENAKGLGINLSRTLRRSVPSDWFNRKWFETMLASMLRISGPNDDEHICLEIDEGKYIKVNNLPAGGTMYSGYNEPE